MLQPRTRIVFGPDKVDSLGELASELGARRALLVSDPGIVQAGHTQRGLESLRRAGIATQLFDDVHENPTTDMVEAGTKVARRTEPEAIIGLGGGSSMDCAKGINFLYSNGGRMQDYWGLGTATADLLPMIAVPTTAGTGSEAQSFALISDAKTHVKMACGDKRAAFHTAVLDPALTVTQPSRVAGCWRTAWRIWKLSSAISPAKTRRSITAAAWHSLPMAVCYSPPGMDLTTAKQRRI